MEFKDVIYKIMKQYNTEEEEDVYEIISSLQNTILRDFESDEDIYLSEIDIDSEDLFDIL